MIGTTDIRHSMFAFSSAVAAMFCVVAGCNSAASPPGTVQGYVEGEFIYIAAPLPGRLETLFVDRGTKVKTGEPLFELENVQEKSAGRKQNSDSPSSVRRWLMQKKEGGRLRLSPVPPN